MQLARGGQSQGEIVQSGQRITVLRLRGSMGVAGQDQIVAQRAARADVSEPIQKACLVADVAGFDGPFQAVRIRVGADRIAGR